MWWYIPDRVSSEEKRRRSIAIRQYSYYAFLIAFSAIFIMALYNFLASKVRRRRLRQRQRLGPSKSSESFSNHAVQTSPSHIRKLVLTFWVLGLLYACFAATNFDLQHLCKRLGRISVALLPPIYLLTLKPSPFPNTFYLELLPLHKWFARITFLVMLGHALLYLYIYACTDKLRKLLHPQNIAGFAAIFLFIAMGLTSLSPIRRFMYRVFYGIHYILSWAVIPLVWHHCRPPANEYIYCTLAILVGQLLYRIFKTKHARLRVQFMSPSLYLVSVPKKDMPKPFLTVEAPGSHVRISEPLWKPLTWIQSSHPYTIASLPHEDPVQLVIRKSNFPIKLRHQYGIMGPLRSVSNDFLDAVRFGQMKRVLFVVGGSGVAFAAPLLRYLHERGVGVKLLWAIRDPQDVAVLKSIGLHEAVMRGDVEVHFTQRRSPFGAASMVEAQMYNYNDDEDLDVAVDDLCCMDTPGPRTRFGSFVGDSISGGLYPFDDSDVDFEDNEVAVSEEDDDDNDETGPLLAKHDYHESNYGSHLDESDAFRKNPSAFICNPNADSSYVCTQVEERDENLPPSSSLTASSSSKPESFVLAPTDKSAPFVASTKTIKSNVQSPKAPTNKIKHASSSQHLRRSSSKFNDIRDVYGFAMFNSRPVLNIRLKLWLCGLSTNNDECCCVDQLITVGPEQRQGGWVISAGTHRLVNDTRAWAKKNKFSFYQEEFTL